MQSKRFRLNKEEGLKIVKVFGWTVASALVVLAMDLISLVEMPVEYAFIVPVVNTVLVALLKFTQGKK